MARYDQERVVAWCRDHYPGETLTQMVRNLVEEAGELANELGCDVDDLVAVLRKSMARGAEGGEIADLGISVLNIAGKIGVDAGECLDEKMDMLSTRTVAESAARVDRKVAAGLRKPVGAA
jgi:hypothetical protein